MPMATFEMTIRGTYETEAADKEEAKALFLEESEREGIVFPGTCELVDWEVLNVVRIRED